MKNPYIYPILFVGTLEVIAFIAVKLLFPGEDITVMMGAITLALGQVVTFLINSAQAELATTRADQATDTAIAAQKQVQSVSDQVTVVNDKSNEALVTSRTGLAALVKSDDLIEFDALADAFAKGELTEQETHRFIVLLELRKRDELTISQLTAAHRMLSIAHKELLSPGIKDKQHVPQSPESVALSKEIQAAEEVKQKVTGVRKEETANAKPDGTLTTVKPARAATAPALIVAGTDTDTVMTLPNVVAAAEKAAESAEETKMLTEEVVVQAAKEIEHKRAQEGK